MSRVDLILFDLDDVLVDYRRDVRCRVLGARVGRDPDAVHAALFGSGLETEADLGRIDPDGTAKMLSTILRTPVTVADCVTARAAAMTERPALLALVETLARRHALAILTNNGVLVRDHFATLCPSFARHFAGRVHCSAMYGVAKPEPEVFRRCAAALDLPPERILFIDDRLDNARGAERAGMLGHHYRDPATLRAALTTLDLLEPPSDAR